MGSATAAGWVCLMPEWGLLLPPNLTPKVLRGQEPVSDAHSAIHLLVLASHSAFTRPIGLSRRKG